MLLFWPRGKNFFLTFGAPGFVAPLASIADAFIEVFKDYDTPTMLAESLTF